jgi:myo-inositol-1(or 4)-monophosphatase
VIVQEAGGKLSDYNGNPFSPFHPDVVASNGLIHGAVLEAIKINH